MINATHLFAGDIKISYTINRVKRPNKRSSLVAKQVKDPVCHYLRVKKKSDITFNPRIAEFHPSLNP